MSYGEQARILMRLVVPIDNISISSVSSESEISVTHVVLNYVNYAFVYQREHGFDHAQSNEIHDMSIACGNPSKAFFYKTIIREERGKHICSLTLHLETRRNPFFFLLYRRG